MQGEGQDKALSSGANWASIEEDCRFCDATEVRYTTLQTRGAGEGSTVFYFCPTCKRGEIREAVQSGFEVHADLPFRYKENN